MSLMSIPSRHLPDVAVDAPAAARALDWVGMSNLALPLRMTDAGGQAMQVAASVDVAVDLHDAHARGIHMSRLYLQLQQAFASEVVTPAGLGRVLQTMVDSQAGLSTRARLVLRYDQLLLRAALASANAGWKRYPVEITASLIDRNLQLTLRFAVDYSSTCPASAALSRQLNAELFAADFAGTAAVPSATVSHWIASERGLAATPHAQRSRADVRVILRAPAAQADAETGGTASQSLGASTNEFPLVELVDAIEAALGTPVQTAVKREDEQAFARLNADNLMFCEDAARRVAAALSADRRVECFDATVSHFESLHAHDAVAHVTGFGPA